MHTGAHAARRRWTALAAAFLFAFQALIASIAQAAPDAAGATAILCTASGPRVVAFDANGDVRPNVPPHSGVVPDCCVAGCPMLGGAPPPGAPPPPLAWRLPETPRSLPTVTADIPRCNAPTRLPRRSRAPPRWS